MTIKFDTQPLTTYGGLDSDLLRARVDEILKLCGISQRELAEVCDIHQPNLNRILTGRVKNPSLETMLRIAHVLGVTVEQLVGLDPIPQLDGDSQSITLEINSPRLERLLRDLVSSSNRKLLNDSHLRLIQDLIDQFVSGALKQTS